MPRPDAETIICTVDVVLLTLRQDQLHVVLLKRDREPFRNALALPGGYVHIDTDQSASDAAARVLLEKTGIVSPYLEQLASFTGPGRDPRGWSVSIAYYALVPESILPAQDEGIHVVPVNRLPSLPFDHKSIVEHALDRVRSKSLYSSLPVYLCGESFTLPQLQAVYESVLGEPINKVSFRRKVDELGMLEAIEGEMQSGRANRPAQLYRLRREFRHSLSMLDRGLNSRMS
ncbi:NUDIX hydrolase [Piscinibacter terrae]|uniref:NUDIX domain-containing protein n=1 Tax=Piscinibacter terrae TaxID=2496871 RepID=A0A3N7HK73_9BURK|nr:NUDIX domain-containing protein [Albitalea terrae]RQP22477.1 NUDIX domain-containing protein [Albitalea terrae]